MDQWQALLDQLSKDGNTQLDVKRLIKILQTVSVLLKDDLADFELEWILKTLLYKPINLFDVIVSKHPYDVWRKPIEDSFKLLASAVTKYGYALHSYFKPIVEVCQLSFEPGTKKQALDCLTCIVKHTSLSDTIIERYIVSLEEATTCKAPLASLIGAVCEYQPAMVTREATRIWRIYLNLLESNKNRDVIVAAIMQGILGLLKNFGQDLPVAELSDFYGKMSTLYIKSKKCNSSVLSMLEHHADLFKERIAGDIGLRRWLWSTLSDPKGAAALLSVYTVVFSVRRSKTLVQCMLMAEVSPRVSTNTISTYTALRIRAHAQNTYGVHVEFENVPAVESLEFQLRSGAVSKDVADSIAWSIECGLMNSDKLLQTCMMFHNNIPNSKLKEIIVYRTLKTTPDIRKASIIFLITETCQDATSFDNYLPLWKMLFDSANGHDTIILEGTAVLFEDFMDYTNSQLKSLVENDAESVPERMSNLLRLCAYVANVVLPEKYTVARSIITVRFVIRCMRKWGICPATVACVSALLCHTNRQEDTGDFFRMLTIDGCKDEALLCECCLVAISVQGLFSFQDNVNAFKVILSRNDVEPKILSEALRQLDAIITNDKPWNDVDFANIISLIKKQRSREHNKTGRDARILQRDITLFLGKHGAKCEAVGSSREDMLVVQLKSSLTLNLLNPDEGVTYKLNLGRILQTALRDENPYVLQTLLTVVSAALVNRKETCLQSAVSLLFRALCRAHAQSELVDPVALQDALLLCDDMHVFTDIIDYIRKEVSPGVRRMLSDALETMMVSDISRDFTEQLINAVGEHALLMMDSSDSLTRKAGLYLTETLAAVQNNNTAAVASLLPDILLKITRTFDQASIAPLKTITEALMEQIELRSNERIEELIQKLLEAITTRPSETSLDTDRIYKETVELCLGFAKNVYEYKRWQPKVLFKVKRGSCKVGWWYVFVQMRSVLGFGDEILLEVLLTCEEVIEELREVISVDNDLFVWETVLTVLTEFAAVLVRNERQKTLEYLTSLISKLTPEIITKISKTLITCYDKYKKLCDGIPEVDNSFQIWWSSLPLQTVTDNLKTKRYDGQTASIISSMKVMLMCFNKQAVDGDLVRSWPASVFQTQITVADTVLEDALTVAIQFLTPDEVTKLFIEYMAGDNSSSGHVLPVHISVFFDYFLRESLLDSLECGVMLNGVVKWCQVKGSDECCDAVLRIVDKLWPSYETQATFEQKVALLLDLGRLPKELSPSSAPWSWATARLMEGGISERIRLVGVLPPGDAYSSAYKSFASLMPTRLGEFSGERNVMLRALLDAAVNGDLTLLNVIASLAAGDETKGWWDEAIDSCMATLALKSDRTIYEVVYKRCWEGLSTGVCERLLIPLLRYSTTSFCEEFLSGVLKELFGILEDVQKQPTVHYEYHKRVVDYTRAFTIIQVAFEKVPQSLESPNTLLYRSLNVQQMWYLVRQTCKLCVTLRDNVVSPPNADDALKISCRKFHCAAYSCLSAAICCRKPAAKFYDYVFDEKAWSSIVDHGYQYELRLRTCTAVRKIRHAVGVNVTDACSSASTTGGSTVRTRVFLRTLTDNPLYYDLIPLESETVKPQEIELAENEVNAHACAATLTALIAHASGLDHRKWLDTLASALTADSHCNVKYLLAQAICNNKAELAPHASVLRQPLFQFVVQTARVVETKSLLNGLHIEVLDTVASWRDDSSTSDLTFVNATVDGLISTIIDNSKNTDIHAILLQCLTRILLVYGDRVSVKWSTFEPYFGDEPTEETKSCLDILTRITKQNIAVPELVPVVLAKLGANGWWQLSKRCGQLHRLASLYGRACVGTSLDEYRTVLDQIRRKDALEYIKMVYYTQMECDLCCDLNNFKRITDLTSSVPKAEKTKCLRIMASYVRGQSSPDAAVSAMFDILDLEELLESVHAEDAMELVKSGLHLMGDEMKRGLVRQVAAHCQHSVVKIREASLGVILKAFQELYPMKTDSRKRKKLDTTPILDSVSNGDDYVDTVMTSLSLGVTDQLGGDGAGAVRTELEKSLHTDDLAIRFVECFIMTVYRPTMRCSGTTGERDLCVCVSVMIRMLLARIRGQESFKKLKLSDGPLKIRDSNSGPSKLLTISKTYQGTVRTYQSMKHGQKSIKNTNSNSSGIDVQLPVDNILEALLKFTEVNVEASISLCIEIVKAVRCNNSGGFDFDSAMSTLLAELVTRPNGLTPLVVELCRVFVDRISVVDGFQKSLEVLQEATRGSEGEGMAKLLLEEVKLRTWSGNELFVLGIQRSEDEDVAMDDSSRRFSIEELMSAFGKLSNWDDMRIQEKKRIEPTLPKIWIDHDAFKTAFDNYTVAGNKTWLDKLVSCCRNEDPMRDLRCLMDLQKWPANQFAITAMTELLYWNTSEYCDGDIEPIYTRRSDCMAEWAARCMIRCMTIRKVFGDSSEESDQHSKVELMRCALANERKLPRLALECIQRNMMDLRDGDTMAWLMQKIDARRTLALRQNDVGAIRNIHEKAFLNYVTYEDCTDPDVMLQMARLMVQLKSDIHDPPNTMSSYIQDANSSWNKLDSSDRKRNASVLNSMHNIAMSYYTDQWEISDTDDRNDLLDDMSEVMKQAIEHSPAHSEHIVAAVLNCLDNWTGVSENAARNILQKLENLPYLHPSVEDIRSHLHVFPPAVLSEFPGLTLRPDTGGRSAEMYRKCFQLVADAGYSLTDYCEKLGRAVNADDREEWKRTFDTMREKIFDNEYAGDDYRVLNKYKNELYDLYDYDKTDVKTKRDTLRNVVAKLSVTSQSVLRLSQLCPELARRGLEAEVGLSTLLRLPPGVNVVSFDERVRVMLGSVRRPCVLDARLTNGRRLRLLHKSGERLRGDACALRAGRVLARLSPPGTLFVHYEVTPLGDDSGLIEYLEDYETLRTIVSDSCNMNQAVPGPADGELILQSTQSSVQRYRKICCNFPATALRSAIERRSSCIQDYIEKKNKFLDSLAFMTMLIWILGLGDRHLNNIMYSVTDGSVCSVDWSALMQYGNPMELAPARLTRNLLAVCDSLVLESRLQSILSSLREAQALLLPTFKIIFKWMGDAFNNKFRYMEGILQGRMLSHEISEDVLRNSNEKYKDKYIQLYENVFGEYVKKETYSVEEQVSNFLQHCTDERILSVVRSDWEPWF